MRAQAIYCIALLLLVQLSAQADMQNALQLQTSAELPVYIFLFAQGREVNAHFKPACALGTGQVPASDTSKSLGKQSLDTKLVKRYCVKATPRQ